jgi:hypothetical protein
MPTWVADRKPGTVLSLSAARQSLEISHQTPSVRVPVIKLAGRPPSEAAVAVVAVAVIKAIKEMARAPPRAVPTVIKAIKETAGAP